MKKTLLIIITALLSFNLASASCSTNYSEIENYPEYKIKINNLFTHLQKKDKTVQKKMYVKLDKVTKKYLQKLNKNTQKKIYIIMGYINCENKKILGGGVWRELTHDNFWNNTKYFSDGDYFFPSFKFSYPAHWEQNVAGDTDTFSSHSFFDPERTENKINIKTHSGFECPEIYTRCDTKIKRNGQEKLQMFINYRKKNGTVFSEGFLESLGKKMYISANKKSYVFEGDGVVVEITFGFQYELQNDDLIKKVLSSIKYDYKKNSDKKLGYGFTLKQNLEKTQIEHNGKIVKTFSHYSRKNPFIDMEGCVALNEIITTRNGNHKTKQSMWNTLSEMEKKYCIQENYRKTIKIKRIKTSRFYEISKQGYEWVNMELFDSKNNIIIGRNFGDVIKDVKEGKTGAFILYEGYKGGVGGLKLLYNNGTVIEVFENNCEQANTVEQRKKCHMINGFELMLNKKIKVFYKNGFQEKKEKIINLNNL